MRPFNSYTSAGPDGITPLMIQKAFDHIIRPLTGILRRCLSFGSCTD